MTTDEFRRLAVSFDGAIEGAHMGHPDFRANGKIFATIYPDGQRGMVKLTPEQQQEFLSIDGQGFEPASGAWGRQGCTTVLLDIVDEDKLGEAMTLAWQNSGKSSTTKRSKGKRPTKAAKKSRPQ